MSVHAAHLVSLFETLGDLIGDPDRGLVHQHSLGTTACGIDGLVRSGRAVGFLDDALVNAEALGYALHSCVLA
jgi:hypothetical protein